MTSAVHIEESDKSASSEETSPSSELVIRPSAKAVKKRWHSKVRTGCDMCKKRRVKCDELKPACYKCTRKGLKCPGYNPPTIKLFELSDTPEFDTAGDKEAYNVFIERGSRIFAIANSRSMDLWVRTIPQLAYQYKAVRHAVIAMGTVQVRALQSEQFPVPQATLVHRARAMQQLYKSDPSELPVEVLACCALFLMILDVWTENGAGPEFHLTALFRLLHEHIAMLKNQGLAPSREVSEIFLPAIDWALVNSLTAVDNFPPPGSPVSPGYKLLLNPTISDSFTDYRGALNSLDAINKTTARYNIGHRQRGIEENISTALARFREQVSRLSSQCLLDPDSSRRNALYEAYLSANWRATKVMFESAEYPSESLFSPLHDADFQHIVVSMKIWLAGEATIPPKQRIPNLGIIPALFLVATKCRDSGLRHDAVELLHDAARSERGWDTCIASVIARSVINTEGMALTAGEPFVTGPDVDETLASIQAHRQRLYVSLAKVDLAPSEGVIRIRYWEQRLEPSGLQARRSVKVSIPYDSALGAGSPTFDILSSKVLRAYGYSGFILTAPEISCQCTTTDRRRSESAVHSWARGFVSYVVLSDVDDSDDEQVLDVTTGGSHHPGSRSSSGGFFHWRPI
ncbi:uncharacterized protein AB675_3121 [Cyphellophora attinorum]|uniref:Zn(2)-C6 fungal-type domain-containing protein n=1 Tax=Cyphellophora attinorum TaxID=1664694 RepID=A0A0N0NKJ1_9EURO|nr:uncharacterized protein AB675_3121 [Phialophora attinorum]KPI37909.1 hypothetical protein AB675_3121 [Phialophora attinorum]